MRNRCLSKEPNKLKADKLFKEMCIKDGVPKTTAGIYYRGLRLFGNPFVDPKKTKKVRKAPV